MELTEGDLGSIVVDLTPLGIPTHKGCFAVRYEGSAMAKAGIFHGDTLMIEKRAARHGEIVLALVDQRVIVRRLVNDGEADVLRSADPRLLDLRMTEQIQSRKADADLLLGWRDASR